MVEEDRVPISILGKEIGTGTGWDQLDSWAIIFYDFQPNDLGQQFLKQSKVKENTDLCIDYETGNVELTEGKVKEERAAEKSGLLTVNWGVFNNG